MFFVHLSTMLYVPPEVLFLCLYFNPGPGGSKGTWIMLIHRINDRYLVDKCYYNKVHYPLESDLSGG